MRSKVKQEVIESDRCTEADIPADQPRIKSNIDPIFNGMADIERMTINSPKRKHEISNSDGNTTQDFQKKRELKDENIRK
jgi:hypothetical protein